MKHKGISRHICNYFDYFTGHGMLFLLTSDNYFDYFTGHGMLFLLTRDITNMTEQIYL